MTYPSTDLSDELEEVSFSDDDAVPTRFDLTRQGDLLLAIGRILAAIQLKKPVNIAQVDNGRAWPTHPAYVPQMASASWNHLNNRWLLTVVRESDGMTITYGPTVEITPAE
jgi:hypothetical protein